MTYPDAISGRLKELIDQKGIIGDAIRGFRIAEGCTEMSVMHGRNGKA